MIVPKPVFAHYMVGLTLNQTIDQWKHDIRLASEASIDGFALNIGPADHFTYPSLHTAYEAAATFTNFSLFLSFDFASQPDNNWDVDYIANLTNTFKDEPAQFKVDGKPLVSTFEGVEFVEEWREVRKKVEGGIVFVPDWSSIGPEGVRERVGEVDGAFSFDAWPRASQSQLTTFSDDGYLSALSASSHQSPNSKSSSTENKIYMMGISPYFYTSLPSSSYNKNWYSPSDALWPVRLSQALSLSRGTHPEGRPWGPGHTPGDAPSGGTGHVPLHTPDMLQIITWNDFAESHYISDLVPSQILPEAKGYVDGYDHGGFRAVLPWYIAAYKAGKTAEEGLGESEWPREKLGDGVVAVWYRTMPVNATTETGELCSDGGTRWGQNGERSAREAVEEDVVNVLAVVRKDTEVVVGVEGHGGRKVVARVEKGGPRFMQIRFHDLGLGPGNRKGGKVWIKMNGEVREGREIRGTCGEGGVLNFNAATVYIAKSTHPDSEKEDSEFGGSGSGSGNGGGKGDGDDDDGDENSAVSGSSVGVTAALVAFLGFALVNL